MIIHLLFFMKNLKELLIKNKFLVFIILATVIFFYPFLLQGKIPIPADTILGLYHPWRDNVWEGKTAGIPFKNYLITDPVRQQYVWRNLAVSQLLKGSLPLWNPYSFSGTPLLANFQTAAFYPLNLLYLFLPFNYSWGLQVMFQPLLAGIFMYLYLRNLKISEPGSLIGSFVYSYSGFSIAWLEWNTIIHTALWLPLILLIIEKISEFIDRKDSRFDLNLWCGAYILALTFAFFAGHLQIFFYLFFLQLVYLAVKIFHSHKKKEIITRLIICNLLILVLTFIQWFPTIQLITYSARSIDQGSFEKAGWFIPWQNLAQFIAPDFFGNPATNNYFGIWNYGEFVGYLGIFPLYLLILSFFYRNGWRQRFYQLVFFLSLLFSLPTGVSKLPYILKIPFISSSQPTRFIYLIVFSACILLSQGFDFCFKEKNFKKKLLPLSFMILILVMLWITVLFPGLFSLTSIISQLQVSRHNLILPTFLIMITSVFIYLTGVKKFKFPRILYLSMIILTVFDLFRFGWKFTPFVVSDWIFENWEPFWARKCRDKIVF